MKFGKLFLMVAALASFTAGGAKAEGFVCQTEDDSLNVKIYHHVQVEDGTRNAAVMVLSDPSVSEGRKTIARFSSVKGTLSNRGALYLANVDLRFNDSARKGENVLGTKLGQLDSVIAQIDFSYSRPLLAGEEVTGTLTLVKRDGDQIEAGLRCLRYLKGE